MRRASSTRPGSSDTPPPDPPPASHRPAVNPGAQEAARRQVLAEWRGVDLTPLEIARTVAAKPVGETLARLQTRLRLEERRLQIELFKVWNQSLDPAVVAHAQPVRLHNGTLFVSVDSSVWLSEIVRYRRHEILERLQHSFGRELIRRISFRVG